MFSNGRTTTAGRSVWETGSGGFAGSEPFDRIKYACAGSVILFSVFLDASFKPRQADDKSWSRDGHPLSARIFSGPFLCLRALPGQCGHLLRQH